MTAYSSRFSNNGAYCFDVGMVSDLAKAMARFLNEEPKISIKLDDDHEIEDTDLAVLVADSYVKSRQIKTIKLEGINLLRFDHPERKVTRLVSVSLGQEFTSTSVSFSVSGDRDACVALRSEIENMLKGSQVWYSRLYPPDNIAFQFLIGAVALIGCTIVAALIAAYFVSDVKDQRFNLIWTPLSLFLFALLIFMRKRMFPKALFDIGHSAKQIKYSKYLQNLVLVTIGLGTLLKFVLERLTK